MKEDKQIEKLEWEDEFVERYGYLDKYSKGIVHRLGLYISKLLLKAKQIGVEEERERVKQILQSRLPDEMTQEEKETYHCEASVLHWGKALLQALTKHK